MRLLSRLLLLVGSLLACVPALAFGLDEVVREAQALAARPWQPVPEIAAASTYDEWRDLRYRRDRALWRGEQRGFEVQFFPAGSYHRRPVQVLEVVDGQPRPLAITRGDFVRGDDAPADDPGPMPVAGLRLLFPLNRADHLDEVIAFLGASYFRALGQGQQYGSSARGLALDTTGAPPGQGEEFPSFVRFWLERPPAGADRSIVYALLDSPRAAGAYRFEIRPGRATEVLVQARLILRAPVARFGLAPLTSMFFSGENQPAAGDFRPEVHDADGLQIAGADGEWLWRPLARPRAPLATSFALAGLRGFGLMQRDRHFASYQDLEAHYQRRPSVWVEPVGDWGPGRVELLQLPATSEADDNIVAFWVPARPPLPGQTLDVAWRLVWAGDDPPAPPSAQVVQTRVGHGYRKQPPPASELQFHIDFAGPALAALPAGAEVEAVFSAGEHGRVLGVRAEPNPALGGWRVTLDVERGDPRQALELRGFLRRGRDTLSETWSYVLPPS